MSFLSTNEKAQFSELINNAVNAAFENFSHSDYKSKKNNLDHHEEMKILCKKWNETQTEQASYFLFCSVYGHPIVGLAMMFFWAIVIYLTMISGNRFRMRFLYHSNTYKIKRPKTWFA